MKINPQPPTAREVCEEVSRQQFVHLVRHFWLQGRIPADAVESYDRDTKH